MTKPILVKFSDQLLKKLDAFWKDKFDSRSAAVREAVRRLIEDNMEEPREKEEASS